MFYKINNKFIDDYTTLIISEDLFCCLFSETYFIVQTHQSFVTHSNEIEKWVLLNKKEK